MYFHVSCSDEEWHEDKIIFSWLNLAVLRLRRDGQHKKSNVSWLEQNDTCWLCYTYWRLRAGDLHNKSIVSRSFRQDQVGDNLILHFCRRYCMDTFLVTGLCGCYEFAENKLTNGWAVTLGKKLIRPMLMADIS